MRTTTRLSALETATGKAIDFFLMKKQAARAERVNVEAVSEFVMLDVGVVEPDLAALDAGKGLFDGSLGGTERFYFCAFEFKAGLIGVTDEVIATCFVVLNRRRHGRHYITTSHRQNSRQLSVRLGFGNDCLGAGVEFVANLALANFLQGDVGEIHFRINQYERSVTLCQLADALGHNIDEEFGCRNLLPGWLKIFALHA